MWRLRQQHHEVKVGDTLGQYRLEALLGQGGMGLVFRAVRSTDGETVALKVLKAELSEDDVYRRRFAHEARSASEVRHPNLVPVLEAGEADGRHYLAVGYVAGRTLEERINAGGPLPVPELASVLGQVAAGLDALHESELVHRDVKVANVMLRDDGTALVTDFGLAKGRAYTVLTRPGQVMGTLDYLAPELIKGQEASPLSDVYALGCVAYECLTGMTPFRDRTVFEVGLAHLQDRPPDPRLARPDCPPALAAAVLSALEKDPAARPQSAGAYADAVRAAA